MLAFVGPSASTASARGHAAKWATTSAAWCDVQTRSMSPTVTSARRRLPANSRRSSGGPSRTYAIASRAIASATGSGVRRCRPLYARIPRRQFSIVLLPKRGTPASAPAAIAVSKSASEAIPYSAKSVAAVFVPMPLTPSTSKSDGGKRSWSCVELVGAPGTHELFDGGADRLADAGKFEVLARGDEIGERRRVFDRSRRLFVRHVLVE